MPPGNSSAVLDVHHVRLERYARFALRLYHIPARERLIAECVIDHTIAAGHVSAFIPLRTFSQQTGIDIRDLKTQPTRSGPGLIERLASKRIVLMHPEADTFSFQPDDTTWAASRRPLAEPAIQEVLKAILAPERGLTVALGELGLEAVVKRLGGGGNPPPVPVVDYHRAGVVIHHQPGGNSPPAHNNRLTGEEVNGETVTGNRVPTAPESEAERSQRFNLLEELIRELGPEGPAELEKWGGRWMVAIRQHENVFAYALRALKDKNDTRQGFTTSRVRWFNKVYENRKAGRTPYPAHSPHSP